MSKSGPLGFILPAALGAGALATGGFGLPALLGDVGATAGEAGAAATLGEATPEFAGGLLDASSGLAGGSLGAAPLSAGAADAAASGALGGVSGLETIAPAAAGLGSVPTLLGPQSGETVNLLSSSLGAPTDLTAGAAPIAPVSATPLSPVAAAGQPLDAAIGTTFGDQGPIGLPDATNLSVDTTGGGGILSTAKDVFGEVGGLKGVTALLSAGLLGSELLKGPQQYPEQTALNQQGAGYLNLGNQLAQPIQTGALPPGAQSAVDLGEAASKAKISTAFAREGLSGSTMEAEALSTADQQAAAQKFGIADQLLSQAQRYSTMGTDVTGGLLKTSMQEDQQYRDALAAFAKALAGTGAAVA